MVRIRSSHWQSSLVLSLVLLGCSDDSKSPPGEAASAAGSSAAASGGACDHACLVQLNTDYLTALTKRDAAGLATDAKIRYTENGTDVPLGEGLWKVATKLGTYRQDFAEAESGQTAGFVGLEDDAGPVLLSFRMKVVAKKVTELEAILARQGQATFFTPTMLTLADPLFDSVLDASARSPRMKMIEIADSYFQGLDSGDGSMIPFDANATRNENGTTTATGMTISNVANFSYIQEITRRYLVVDQERGVVFANIIFQIPMSMSGPRTLHLSEAFKVDGGKIMKIQAIMVNQPLGTRSGWDDDGTSFMGNGISP